MAKVISVTSGKGGVGKSTLCVGLGMAYALLGKNVLLIEFDVGLRGMDLMLGVSDKIVYDLGDLLEGRCNINKAIVESPWNPDLNVIVAPIALDSPMVINDVKLLLEGLRKHFDVIILDTPAGLGVSMNLTSLSDLALVVATPDYVCVRDGNKVVNALHKMDFKNHRLVINRVNQKLLKKNIVKDLDEVIDGVSSQLIGALPEDQEMQLCVSKGMPLSEKSKIVNICKAIALRIEGEYVPLFIK